MIDQYKRKIDYLRISITDRCNLRCQYCLPENCEFLRHEDIMSYEEIVYFTELLAPIGIKAVKITGGEPLIRKNCTELIKKIKAIDGIENVTLTTNGVFLRQYLPELTAAGLDAVNISLDTLNENRYKEITGFDFLAEVLAGIRKALSSSLQVKVNCVIVNSDSDWRDLIDLARHYPLDVRFIELMPIGAAQGKISRECYDVCAEFQKLYPQAREDFRVHGNGPAKYYTVEGFCGSIGFISAVSHKFCEECNRIRLTSTGILKRCLCFDDGIDVRAILRRAISDREKTYILREVIYTKPKEHLFSNREEITEKRNMAAIGG